MKKRLLSMVMLFCMTLSLLPAAALAAPEDETAEPVPVRVAVPEKETVALQENTSPEEDLFYQYMLRRAQEEQDQGSVSLFSTKEGDKDYRAYAHLSKENYEQKIYTLMREKINNVVNGTETSTDFYLTAAEIGITKTRWTSEELFGAGVHVSLVDSEGYYTPETVKALAEKIGDTDAIVEALLFDCPYDLYWYYKLITYCYVDGWLYNGTTARDTIDIQGMVFRFYVNDEYADETDENYLTVDRTIMTEANKAVSAALSVVAANADKSDYQKLLAYKDYICSQVSYNTPASHSPAGTYGNPWQLIWVFVDDIPGNVHKVVCEGYSKAFQYLCDLTDFQDSRIQCYTVTGKMDGGGHMWNIVSMPDEKNYFVDVTNCDSGMYGAPDKLFLKAVTMVDPGIKPTGFTATAGTSSASYEYDVDTDVTHSMIGVWGSDLLNLCESDYGEFQVTYNAAPGYVDEGKTLQSTTVTEYRNGSGDLLTPLYWGKEGDLFSFDGWFKDGETTKTTPEEIRAACTDVVLKAKWTCWVAFDGNGGTPEVTSEPGEPGGTVPVPEVTRGTGGEYILDGWYDAAAGGSKKLDADAATYPVNASDTLYAQWQAKVTYDGNGGTPATPSEYVLLGDTTVLPTVTRDGSAFIGWYTMADGGDYIGAAGQTYTVSETAAKTLYAHWNCDLTLDANGGKLKNKTGGEVESLTETVPAGTRLSAVKDLPSTTWDGNDPAQAGFEFAGWWTMATGGEQVVDTDTAPYNITGDTTLYAHWNSLGFSYLLTYDANGGNISTLPESVQYPETGVTEESAHTFVMDSTVKPTWENHYFRGWGVSSDATTPVTSIEVDGVRGDVATATAYALWLPIETSLDMVVGTTQSLPGMPTEGMTWTSSDASVAVVCDGIFVARGVGEAIITATSDSSAEVCYYLVTVGPSTDPDPLSTMTTADGDSLDWFIQKMGSAGKKVIVAGTDTGINANKPVLVASYQNGKMLSVEFITTALDSVDVSSDATSVKLFWVDTSAGFTPRCASQGATFLSGE